MSVAARVRPGRETCIKPDHARHDRKQTPLLWNSFEDMRTSDPRTECLTYARSASILQIAETLASMMNPELSCEPGLASEAQMMAGLLVLEKFKR